MFQLVQLDPTCRLNLGKSTPLSPTSGRYDPVDLVARFTAVDLQDTGRHTEIPYLGIVQSDPFNPNILWLPHYVLETLNNRHTPIREITPADGPTLENVPIKNIAWYPT